jgi:hypothetical protein
MLGFINGEGSFTVNKKGSLRKNNYSLGISSKKDLNSLNNLLNNTGLIGLKGHKLIQYLN